jgi:preprotein translocase subunit SecD
VRLAEDEPAAGLQAARVANSTRLVYLHPEVVVTNDDIAGSRVIAGDTPAHFWIAVRLNDAGADKMRRATLGHLGRLVAILIDGNVVATPRIKSPIGAAAVISGDFSRAEAERIAQGMNPNQ